MKYDTRMKYLKIKSKIVDIMLYPIRCICTPIYEAHDKGRKCKRYTYNQVKKVIEYMIDYWTDNDDIFVVAMDDTCFIREEDNDYTKNPYHLHSDICYGWNGENKKLKRKASHMYFYQKELYLDVLRDICEEKGSRKLTQEDKVEIFKWRACSYARYDMYLFDK